MREGIHPEYKPAKVVCACGNVVETRSVRGDFHIEICAACHPFFTGKQKIMDTAGRIEKFKNRYGTNPLATSEQAPKVAPPPAAPKKAAAPPENRAAKRAKAGKSKTTKTEAAPAEAPAPEAKAE